ncbi:hypothetical protein AU468_07435 [Alkalispirochaeta sphaeroplastigenens]|uniref:Phage shock protein PspC N-terminal domain-containing protein n=1 Tax=Alkalispirochaeta sphaeroplastigenens TaxID=1187066 RepID=A0A2S4JQM9_9SPIO|nr:MULTISPECIES: PspC domain-containing protein [Alkalispirochaeta]POR01780.1 hypothetical protein AU468_07435 [Alkalispirochaeta sphaeroplastigenens]
MSDYRVPEGKKLYRSRRDRKLLGVCGGIAEYFGVDSTLVRLITILLVLVSGSGFLAYFVAALIMKENPG